MDNKLYMENPKQKRGISLSHHTPSKNKSQPGIEESQVRQVAQPFTPNFTNQTPRQPRISSAPKPTIIFSYPRQSSANGSTPYLYSAQSNPAFTQSPNIKKQQITYIRPPKFLPGSPRQFEIARPHRVVQVGRLFTPRKQSDREGGSEMSSKTERKNHFINSQNGISHDHQSLKNAFVREQYEKLIQNRKRNLEIINKVVSYNQEAVIPSKIQEPFSKIQLPQQQAAKNDKKGAPKMTTDELRNLKGLEKRLKEIINICDSKLV